MDRGRRQTLTAQPWAPSCGHPDFSTAVVDSSTRTRSTRLALQGLLPCSRVPPATGDPQPEHRDAQLCREPPTPLGDGGAGSVANIARPGGKPRDLFSVLWESEPQLLTGIVVT